MKTATSILFLAVIILIITLPIVLNFKKQKKVVESKLNKETEPTMRVPVATDGYYPAKKDDLIDQIYSLLKEPKVVNPKSPLRILIVPHAGFDYSGQTAAWGFKQVENSDYNKVILLGVSHHAYFQEAAVYSKGSWQTPLGEVEIDEELASTLINQSGLIKENLAVHQQEHSLEVELPFLQRTLNDFKIIPILLSYGGKTTLDSLTDAISNNFDERTLLVISSDLSHYPEYKIANKLDKETINTILTGEVETFSQKIQENLEQDNVVTRACGAEAIKIGMMVAEKLGMKKIVLLDYRNSGDQPDDEVKIPENKSRVVGYTSIGFYGALPNKRASVSSEPPILGTTATGNPPQKQTSVLNNQQQKKLLEIARKTLESFLKDKTIPGFNIEDESLKEKVGAFVTLRKNGELRGCIGQFEPKEPLYKTVQQKTIDAALNDSRFSSLKAEEIKDIKIEISVLSKPVKIDDWKNVEVGKHGVLLIKDKQGATFLPQVATENNWDSKTFLENLCISKAGLPKDCYQNPGVQLFIYTAQVFSEA